MTAFERQLKAQALTRAMLEGVLKEYKGRVISPQTIEAIKKRVTRRLKNLGQSIYGNN